MGPGGRRITALILLLTTATAAHSVQPDEILPNAGLEKRARTLGAELRCLVCQNQSVDESDAPLARDLRLLVRERLKEGDSDAEVLRFVVARYGEFVLLRPPVSAGTLLLWLGPVGMVIAAAFGLLRAARRRAASPESLSEADEAQLARLLGDDGQAAATRRADWEGRRSASTASLETGLDSR